LFNFFNRPEKDKQKRNTANARKNKKIMSNRGVSDDINYSRCNIQGASATPLLKTLFGVL